MRWETAAPSLRQAVAALSFLFLLSAGRVAPGPEQQLIRARARMPKLKPLKNHIPHAIKVNNKAGGFEDGLVVIDG
ncbi:MAG: hypothetical protein ACE5ID_12680, partial [Acidobacteriota bacterium]